MHILGLIIKLYLKLYSQAIVFLQQKSISIKKIAFAVFYKFPYFHSPKRQYLKKKKIIKNLLLFFKRHFFIIQHAFDMTFITIDFNFKWVKLFSTFCKGKFIQRDKNIITKKSILLIHKNLPKTTAYWFHFFYPTNSCLPSRSQSNWPLYTSKWKKFKSCSIFGANEEGITVFSFFSC